MKPCAGILLATLATPAAAADLLAARYDAPSDRIVVEVAYRGTSPQHTFRVEWGACRSGEVAARLIDQQGAESARTSYRVSTRLGLEGLPCRPAVVTLRLGRNSQASVKVPHDPH